VGATGAGGLEVVIKLGIVGAGAVANLHVRSARRIEGVELVGFFARDREVRATRSAEWSTKAFPSYTDLLNHPGIDAIVITSHVDSHLDFARQALLAGKHVLVEKPVDISGERIRDIARLARERGLLLFPGHNYAYLPEARRLIETVRAGSIGAVRAVFVNYAVAHEENLAARYGNVLDEVMVHHAYLTLATLGVPTTITAGEMSPAWMSLDSSDQSWMTWAYHHSGGSTSAHLFATFAVDDLSDSPQTLSMKALGTLGSSAFTWRTTTGVSEGGPFSVGLMLYEETFVEQMMAFRDAINGTPWRVLSSIDDAATVADLMQIARAAVTTGSTIGVQLQLDTD